ncbi:hypothetical protein RB195_014905 [Necator americanus]|uniref:Uncharacterized protein n=1 Tax=Necator americanus TaxID=51031 RepID=A0ABR1E236_NECAM
MGVLYTMLTLTSEMFPVPVHQRQLQNAAVDMSSVPQLQSAGSVAGAGPDEVYQHGTIGTFLRQELEGGFSSFIRCVYQAKRVNNNTVTLVLVSDILKVDTPPLLIDRMCSH